MDCHAEFAPLAAAVSKDFHSMADSGILTLHFPEPDIAVLTFDDPAQGGQRAIEHRAGGTGAAPRRSGRAKRPGRRDHSFAASRARSSPAPTCASSPPRSTCPREQIVAMCQRGQQAVRPAVQNQRRHRGGDRWHLRRRRGRTGHLVRPADHDRRRQNAVRLSRGQAGAVSRLGRHGPRVADRRPGQCRRNGHQRRIDRRPNRRR